MAATPTALLNDVYAFTEAAMRGLDAAAEDALLERWPLPLRMMHVLNWLEFEVVQGSFHAYFDNSHRRHAALAEAALRELGAFQQADALAEAGRIDKRVEGDARWEAFRAPTDRFHDASGGSSWGERLERFLWERRAEVLAAIGTR